ncbi:MAG: glutamine--fructose-6-phosphate transaminase (isomerizing) [Clostridia bacterium]|nr:glutamine--fructose-6-phosphate transaminase (isomerizing) [Clostridia bacterium]
MCGITGYVGAREASEVILQGLHTLEYRGYDSAGIAAFANGNLAVVKAVGKVQNVEEKVKALGTLNGAHCGIGHTRWATHGAPSDINSHPHGNERIQIVHNGIIENYAPLRAMLQKNGYTFVSETDTEVAAKLIDYHYANCHDRADALIAAMRDIVGSYAIAVLFADCPDTLYAIRKDNPLIVGVGEGESFVASDIAAVLRYTKNYYQLGDHQLAVVTKDRVSILDMEKTPVEHELLTATWSIEAAERGGYAHFMIKEIGEEPEAIEKTLRPRIKDMLPCFEEEGLDDSRLAGIKSVTFVACGTAMHAGLVGKTVIEKLCRVPVNVEIASEFRYNDPILNKDDLVVIISQSGETADSLAALRLAKEKGAYTLGIVNVIGSTIAREADDVIYTWAGPEISVASTKAYTVQISLLYLLSIRMALAMGKLTEDAARSYTRTLYEDMPRIVREAIALEDEVAEAAALFCDYEDLFFIGRGIDYHLAMEGSLKLKEISYIHSEAYAAGELKHGTISLITEDMPVIALATTSPLYEKMISNIREVKARGAEVLLITREGAKDAADEAKKVIYLPNCSELFSAIPLATILQLLAYHVAAKRGCDIDKPRNLAKSVTVE